MKPRSSEKGIALLVALFALILVAAIGLAMMYASNGETGLNSGYRQSNLAFFGARSGVESLRDRMRVPSTGTPPTNPNGIGELLPTSPIGTPGGVLYLINNTTDVVAPWDKNNPYFDDELCHETANALAIPGAPGAPNKRCTNGSGLTQVQLPGGGGACAGAACWYRSTPALPLPNNAPIPYKWARATLKLNESANPWCVLMNSTNPAIGCPASASGAGGVPAGPSTDQVCYNGQNEFVLADLKRPLDVPGRVEGETLPTELSQLAMYMYGGGSTSHGTGGHSGTTSGTTGSTTGSTSSGTTTSTSGTTTSTSGTTTSGSTTSLTTSSGTTTSGSTSSGTTTSGSTTSGTTTSGSTTSGTTTSGTTTGTTGLAGTTTATSTSGTTTGSTTGTTTSTTTGVAGTGTTGGSPAPSCGVNSPPAQNLNPLVGVGSKPVQAASCFAAGGSTPVYMLTALAVAPGSTTRRMLQYEVAKVPLPSLPAAVTIAGPLSSASASVDNSSNFFINGTDQCGVANVPAVGTVAEQTGDQAAMDAQATQSMNNFVNAIPNNRVNHYTGVDGCSPDVQNVNHLSDQMFNTVDGLQGLVKTVEGAASNTYGTNPSSPNIGCFSCSPASQQVTVVQGDLTLSSTDGYGILLVTGKLTLSGDFSYHGLILVIGQGEIDENGGGSGGIVGGLVLAKIGNNSGCGVAGGTCYSTNPTDQNLLQHLGPPVYNYPGGGSNGFTYNSCMLQKITAAADFAVIARREITY